MNIYDEALISVNYLEQEIVKLRPHIINPMYEALIKDLIIVRGQLEQAKKEHELLSSIASECSEYIKKYHVYTEGGYWSDLIGYLENKQYGTFIKEVLYLYQYGPTCDYAGKMLGILNEKKELEKEND